MYPPTFTVAVSILIATPGGRLQMTQLEEQERGSCQAGLECPASAAPHPAAVNYVLAFVTWLAHQLIVH